MASAVTGDAKSLCLRDVDGDNLPDVVIGVNSGALRVFTNRSTGKNRLLGVRLRGASGNPNAAGARITVKTFRPQCAEMTAGGGYLSQDSPVLWFGLGESNGPVDVEVQWPGGNRTQHKVSAGLVELKP